VSYLINTYLRPLFDVLRSRFDNEMKKMEDEMNKFR
jgi:hypothetical protein